MRFLGMIGILIKNLIHKPATILYPFEKKPFLDKSRGQIQIEIDNCIFCGICQKKCPTNAIIVQKETKTWQINRLNCITCNACVEVCPKKCLLMENCYSAAVAQPSAAVFTYSQAFTNK